MLTLICPPKNACRTEAKNRIINILSNLQGKATGARLVSFGTTPAGTLPITATWKGWHYPYSAADGTKGTLTTVVIDLGPALVGGPAYALIQDETGQRFTFTIAAADAQPLINQMYLMAIPLPPPAPDSGGGGTDLTPWYQLPFGAFCATLQDCVIAR